MRYSTLDRPDVGSFSSFDTVRNEKPPSGTSASKGQRVTAEHPLGSIAQQEQQMFQALSGAKTDWCKITVYSLQRGPYGYQSPRGSSRRDHPMIDSVAGCVPHHHQVHKRVWRCCLNTWLRCASRIKVCISCFNNQPGTLDLAGPSALLCPGSWRTS